MNMTLADIKVKFNVEDTVFEITQDIDLEGSELNMRSGCSLSFKGGSIINGILTLNKTKILPNSCIISDYITAEIQGTYAKGQCLYDTTLNKPKWWNGTNWIDATGATV